MFPPCDIRPLYGSTALTDLESVTSEWTPFGRVVSILGPVTSVSMVMWGVPLAVLGQNQDEKRLGRRLITAGLVTGAVYALAMAYLIPGTPSTEEL